MLGIGAKNARYSEFDDLRAKLVITFPKAKKAMPPLPPKSILSDTSSNVKYCQCR